MTRSSRASGDAPESQKAPGHCKGAGLHYIDFGDITPRQTLQTQLPGLRKISILSDNFGTWVNYRQPPDPPLSSEDAAWANRLLREHGLR
jgi:hypothetical protein